MESNSFVYCWTDKATSKLYVGFHKGAIDDGYVCSSKYMLAAQIGKKRPEGFGAKISAIQLGKKRKPHTETTKERLRQASFGKKHTPETIAKLKDIKSNVSDETRKKISDAKKAYYAAKRNQKCH